ncbi:MAG: N-acetylmuramoyl-L-alanine amidase [Clostridia bacterium]|nr:N-acetylmuramoyl-L-alanine amidase [Clostridia bacterium]MBR0356687.1 N-acetylmuramoyl-L-alanine amidase [Clostridia bacterium]
MKQIKKRRRILRIGNPIGFSLFCLVCLALMAGLYLGISWAIKNGPGVVKAMRTAVQEEVMTTPTVEPSREPKDELLPTATPTPSPTPEPKETPDLGTPVATTPTPEPTIYVTAPPQEDMNAALYGQIIGIDPCRDSTKHAEEAENNLIIANHLKRYLESQGATVVLGRTEEDRGKVDDNTRAKIFRNAGCTYVIRLKCNYINAKTSACYVKVTKKNKAFGQRMINAYVAATGMQKQNGKKDGVQVEDDTVAEKCGCPCVAFLMGNWDNETDYANLHDEVFMDKITEGIFNGLMAEISDEPGSTEADAPLEAPTITTQPTDVTVVEGGNLNLSVVATGSDLKYQWELKAPMGAWTKLTSTSARTANLSIPNVQTRHTGYTYRCTVSNKAGKVTSNVVTLTVNPASTSQP